MNYNIYWMTRKDLLKVLEIENESFNYPWSEKDFVNCLRQRTCISMVITEDREKILGYMIYELFKKQLSLMNLAVDTAHRRRGIGTIMIQKLIGKLNINRRTRILFEISENNLEGQLFLQSLGFRARSILHNYYEVGGDAYLMEYSLRTRNNEKWMKSRFLGQLNEC